MRPKYIENYFEILYSFYDFSNLVPEYLDILKKLDEYVKDLEEKEIIMEDDLK